MPLLINPLALLGLAAVPGLVAIYFLYNRFRRREVSSVFLWRGLGRRSEGHGKWRLMLPPPAFWLELLIVLLLVLAAVDLCWKSRQALRPLVVVLDDSLSMQAVGPDMRSSQQRAREALDGELRALSPSSVRVVLAGRTPHLSARVAAGDIGSVLKPWHCRSVTADLDKALLLARTHGKDARVLVLSDQPPATPVTEPMVKWLAVGRPLTNAGILNAARTAASPAQDRVLVEVRNCGPERVETALDLTADGKELFREKLALAPGEDRTVLTSVPATAGRIRASLGADPLTADNACDLLPAWRPRVRVEVRVTGKVLRDALLKALHGSGMAATEGGTPQVLFSDTATSVPTGNDAWVVRFQTPVKGEMLTGPFVLNRSHPLCDGIELEGTVWCGAALGADGTPVIMAGDLPLVTETVLPGGRRLIDISLDPTRSTLIQSANWPVFIWNLLHWRALTAPGFGDNRALCGQWVRLSTTQAGEDVRLIQPDGQTTTLHVPADGREAGFVPEIPGLYRAETSAGVFELSCLPGVPGESDLTVCGSGTYGAWDSRYALQHGYWSSAAGLALLALAAFAAHSRLVYGPAAARQQ